MHESPLFMLPTKKEVEVSINMPTFVVLSIPTMKKEVSFCYVRILLSSFYLLFFLRRKKTKFPFLCFLLLSSTLRMKKEEQDFVPCNLFKLYSLLSMRK